MEHLVSILDIQQVANRVSRFRVERPAGFTFEPGQATDIAVPTAALKAELRPFTFTSLPEDAFLEFTIKRYPDHHGVTDAIHRLKKGDELLLHDVWGAITYKGPGYFIAGGAGITPFLAILRGLHKTGKLEDNMLLFSNRTAEDIICENELEDMMGKQALFVLTQETKEGYLAGPIDKVFLQQYASDTSKKYYVCGPDAMVTGISGILEQMGIDTESVVFEK